MKSKARGKSNGLARVGKVLLGAALLAVDQVREKLAAKLPVANAKVRKVIAKTRAAARSATVSGSNKRKTPATTKPKKASAAKKAGDTKKSATSTNTTPRKRKKAA
jgi:hypothetical protein